MSSIKKDILWRLYVMLILIVVFGLVIVLQIAKLQFIEGDQYIAKADSLHLKYQELDAERGSIYADGGDLLAASFPYYDIILDPLAPSKTDFTKNVDSLAICLAQLFGDKSKAEYKQKIMTARNQGKRYLVLKNKATVKQMQAVKTFPMLRLGKYEGGLMINPIERRTYPYGSLAGRTVGYVKEGTKVGLEGSFDVQLSGIAGKRLMQKVSGGTWISVNDDAEIMPEDGNDIITTIDVNMQDITETALRRSLVNNNAEWGTAIVLEVKTGKVKAIANLTRQTDGSYAEVMNNAIATKVEPGSTFKLFSLMVLFEDGYITINDSVDLEFGAHAYPGATMYDSEEHNRRNVSIRDAFALSSNVGISRLVYDNYKNNPQQFLNHIQDCGLGSITGIEIPGEPKPFFRTNPQEKGWSKISLPWMSVGYELQITALQLATFYNAIANNGKMMKPYLVSETSYYGEQVEHFDPIVMHEKICSDKTIKQLKECLSATCDSTFGTGYKNLHNDFYKIAGKTGTARIAEGGGYAQKYLASFAGYFPADNPKYTCVVLINKPSNGVFYGGYVSGPVFKEIADKIYSHHIGITEPVNQFDTAYLGVTAFGKGYRYDFEEILDWLKLDKQFKEDADWITVHPKQDSLAVGVVALRDQIMPSVKGMGLRDALYMLENEGLIVHPIGKGKVHYQSIDPGQIIRKGTYITIKLI